MNNHAGMVGQSKLDIDTPALLIDLSAMERNLARMAAFFADTKAKLRPHGKTHKCPILAQKQLEAGNAVGITCAKLGEAEVLVAAGIRGILIANQMVGRRLPAENGILYFTDPSKKAQLGERLEIIPNNASMVVAIHDEIYGVRKGEVERVFRITGRGAGN